MGWQICGHFGYMGRKIITWWCDPMIGSRGVWGRLNDKLSILSYKDMRCLLVPPVIRVLRIVYTCMEAMKHIMLSLRHNFTFYVKCRIMSYSELDWHSDTKKVSGWQIIKFNWALSRLFQLFSKTWRSLKHKIGYGCHWDESCLVHVGEKIPLGSYPRFIV